MNAARSGARGVLFLLPDEAANPSEHGVCRLFAPRACAFLRGSSIPFASLFPWPPARFSFIGLWHFFLLY
jgi:hypothetical protein